MLVWIFGNRIAGIAQSEIDPPSGFSIAMAPELDLDLLYWDGSAVQIKSAPPSDTAYWDETLLEWREPAPLETPVEPNWNGLFNALQESDLWATAFAASSSTLACNSAFTMLYGTLTTDRSLRTLEWSIAQLRAGMTAPGGPGDFTTQQISAFNQLLETYNFPFSV